MDRYCPARRGVLDPSPFVDPATGAAYLFWKSNDGSSSAPSQVWSVRLDRNGTGFAGTPTVLLTVDQPDLPWETTFDDPQMVFASAPTTCSSPPGISSPPAIRRRSPPVPVPPVPAANPSPVPHHLRERGYGPGGGSLFQDASGNWWLGYAGWTAVHAPTYGLRCDPAAVRGTHQHRHRCSPCTPPAGTPMGYRLVAQRRGHLHLWQPAVLRLDRGIQINQPVVGMAGTLGRRRLLDGRTGRRRLRLRQRRVLRLDRRHPPQPAHRRHGRHPGRGGYWLVASDGGIFAFGDAAFYGSTGPSTSTSRSSAWPPPRTAVATGWSPPTAASSAFGDAAFYGSTGASTSTSPIVGMAATPDGGGYWLVASDGGIFTFGDAAFYGSTGGIHLNQPSSAWPPPPNGGGYWLVASDGGVFAFGDAAFYGSTGGIHLNRPVVGMSGP